MFCAFRLYHKAQNRLKNRLVHHILSTMATSTTNTATQCQLCDNSLEEDLRSSLCKSCSGLSRSEIFSRIHAYLQGIRAPNGKINSIDKKCQQFKSIIQKYTLHAKSFSNFDPVKHDVDRDALKYLENNVPSENNETLENHLPVKINISDGGFVYESIAFLCGLKPEDVIIELRVRTLIDVILNCQKYISIDSELHLRVQLDITWMWSILEQLFGRSPVGILLINCINAFSDVFLD